MGVRVGHAHPEVAASAESTGGLQASLIGTQRFLPRKPESIVCNYVTLLAHTELSINKMPSIKTLRIYLKEEDLFIKFVNKERQIMKL